jgi:hypothetical protein
MKQLLMTLLFALISFMGIGQSNCPCEPLLKDGLYKTFKFQKTTSFEKDFKSYLETEEFKKDFKDKKWNVGIDVVVESVPLGLDAGASDNEINEFQRKVKAGSSLKVKDDFFSQSFAAIPDVDLAKAYTDCVAKSCAVGFSINANMSEKDAFFLINFKPLSVSDPMPTVTDFVVKGGKNLKSSFKIGDKLLEQNTVSCDRDGESEIVLLLTTDKGTVPYRVPANPSGFNKDFPVGTIITSYLTWQEFQLVTKNNMNNPDGNIWNGKFSKWAPCDGRRIASESGFSRATGGTINLPDMRGLFLRGYNQFDQNEGSQSVSTVADEQKDPETRVRGKVQTDALKSHGHTMTIKRDPRLGYRSGISGAGYNSGGDFENDTNTYEVSTNKTVNGNPDETRPKNMAVYYYIRIN